MKASRRISVRLEDTKWEQLRARCGVTQTDVSRCVRQAIEGFLNTETGTNALNAAKKRLTPPQTVLDCHSAYLSWVDGDLREERKRLFRELLAACFTCKKLWPRTPGILEGYEELLQLCDYFGFD